MFETFEHKADIGVRGSGKSIEQAFAECAKAMFSVIADLKGVQAKEEVELETEAESRENLLVSFLNELLYLHDAKQMIFNKFDLYITGLGENWKIEGKLGAAALHVQPTTIGSRVADEHSPAHTYGAIQQAHSTTVVERIVSLDSGSTQIKCAMRDVDSAASSEGTAARSLVATHESAAQIEGSIRRVYPGA